MIKPQQPPRFDIDSETEEFLSYLEEHGYAVVAGVADAQQVEKAQDLLWDFFENLEGYSLRRDDPSTWSNDSWLPSPTNGIMSGFGFGQCKFMWHLRLLPKVKKAFAAIWKTTDLLVSFDGGNMFRPWKYDSSWVTQGGWFHVDQNHFRPNRQGKVCVQGLVTLCDADETTGGLLVVPGSHLHHERVCEKFPHYSDFVPLDKDDPLLADGSVLVCAKAGDLILWDSRTVHCNTPALNASEDLVAPKDQTNDWKLIRQVGYVCMTPASFATKEVIEARKGCFVDGHSNSHWPHACVIGSAGIPGNELDPEAISSEQRALIGYDRGDEQTQRQCAIM
jgi:ectoine hydroxylase-related dioxygenase (phytanoyl-CoA dioxygenase family)